LRAGVLVAVALLSVPVAGSADTIGGATASNEVVVKRGDRGPAVRTIQRALGMPADGVFGPQTDRAVRSFQRGRGLMADGVVGPLTRTALGLPPFTRSSVRRGAARLPTVLRRIAECESGGDPHAVSRDGRYRGKYQFTLDTWRNLGGDGDPADAPEWLQDRLALELYRSSGTAPWPNCA